MPARISRRKLAHFLVGQIEAEAPLQSILRQLAAYLVESRRTKEIDLIIRDVEALLADRGTVLGTVITAHELSVQTYAALEAYVQSELSAPTVKLTREVKPDLLGGFRVETPGHVLDRSIRHQLTQLKTTFKKA